MRIARLSDPYNVNVLDYCFLKKNYDVVCDISSLWPMKIPGDTVVSDLAQIKYLPQASTDVQNKICIEDDWSNLLR